MEAATTSFSSRRPAVHALPQFHLPTPTSRFEYQVPRVTGSEAVSPFSPGVHGGSPQTPQHGTQAFSNHSSWPLPVTSSYTQSSMNHGALMQPNYGRPIYSPTGPSYPRSSQSPATADGLPAPTYDSGSSPYSLPTLGAGNNHHSLLSQSSNQHHQVQQQILQTPMMNNNHSQGSQPPTPSTTASQENYPRPTPYYSSPVSTSHQLPFSFAQSPSQTSATTAGVVPRGIPALSSQPHPPPMQTPHFQQPPGYGYPSGSVLSNMTNPGGRMSLVGPMHLAHQYGPQGQVLGHHMYGHAQQSTNQERPYKCDICSQSFSRNHDLKRHKRIHLAIKPFPCTFCEKSFSRKDALKRHRLVKNCGAGKNGPDDGNDIKSPSNDTNRGSGGPSNSADIIKEESS
ncbi:hypothetical protein F4804DRAFT_17336 [Jackrogersella minutella]|nr:hypothetical protein F4804DRAFT_17336 [Jackrogersella minutella]